jgi:hypothetical protein
MFCQNCGTALADGTSICHHCGSPPLRAAIAVPSGIENDPAMRMLLPVGRSVWAILAGGLFAVLGICAPFALILGIVALIDIKRHPEKHGMGRAIFAIVMGVLGMLVPAIILAIAIYVENHR